MFDIDLLGGEVVGCFDLVDMIYMLCGDKLVWVILFELVYLVVYVIVSVVDWIIVLCIGGVGLIGVIMMYVDWLKVLIVVGVVVMFIIYGDCKVDFYLEILLFFEVFVVVKLDINIMGELFVNIVVCNWNFVFEVVCEM